MKKIAILNQKGGSGKTTTTANLGAALSFLKKRILLIDIDPQAHLTQSLFGNNAGEINKSIYDLLRGASPIEETIIKRGRLDVVPSSLDLAASELELSSIPGREFLLKDLLEDQDNHDYCFIDCPPSLGLLTIMALTAARKIIIPLQVEFLALHSLSKLMETISMIKKRINPSLELDGVLATRFDGRKKLNREIIEKARAYFKGSLYKTIIRENISLAEGPSYGKTIFEYLPKSHGAEDYMNLAREFLRRGKK